MNLLSARPFCLLFGAMPKSKSRNGIHNEHPTSSRNHHTLSLILKLNLKKVETESIMKLIFEVKLKWSFHRISCKFFRNRVSLFREKEREGKYLPAVLRNAMK
jgi:hypothetical protein